jgi:hypothetical protein
VGYFSCTESNAFPVLDAASAVGNGIGLAYILSNRDKNTYESTTLGDSEVGALVFGTGTILYTISAFNGFATVDECRSAKEEWGDRISLDHN